MNNTENIDIVKNDDFFESLNEEATEKLIVPETINLRQLKFQHIANIFLEQYFNHQITSKSEFCRNHKISHNTLNKYLKIIIEQ